MQALTTESLRTLCNMVSTSCKDHNGNYLNKAQLKQTIINSGQTVGAVVLTLVEEDMDEYTRPWERDLSIHGDAALDATMEEINFQLAQSKMALQYRGMLGYVSKNKIEMVFVTEPTKEEIQNAVMPIHGDSDGILDSGDIPNARVTVYMGFTDQVPSLQTIAARRSLKVLFTPTELTDLRISIAEGKLNEQSLRDLLLHNKNVPPNLVRPMMHAIMHYNLFTELR